ncbi:hypothetical protein [Stratiformator vulcanicus]|uniref:Transmembrane protein n=1 Tax=Stratiformator vulcanicus TaxID=2527980 RepID=A0A517R7S5_9PLAN|nr:hypothetical protein [Stratiformator vulcanicus]QDT39938.1 hypothetical protein Pan189_43500 [Stratiformator vulcanicus]
MRKEQNPKPTGPTPWVFLWDRRSPAKGSCDSIEGAAALVGDFLVLSAICLVVSGFGLALNSRWMVAAACAPPVVVPIAFGISGYGLIRYRDRRFVWPFIASTIMLAVVSAICVSLFFDSV